MQKDLLRAQRRLAAQSSTLLCSTLLLCALVWLTIHAANAYPGFLARARRDQEDAAVTYSRNCLGGVPATRFVDCGQLASVRDTNVHASAADQTLTHLADDLNVFRWMGCVEGGWCSQLLQILFSWAYILLPALCGVLLFYLYTVARTFDSYYSVQHLKAQAKLATTYNPHAAIVNVMKQL